MPTVYFCLSRRREKPVGGFLSVAPGLEAVAVSFGRRLTGARDKHSPLRTEQTRGDERAKPKKIKVKWVETVKHGPFPPIFVGLPPASAGYIPAFSLSHTTSGAGRLTISRPPLSVLGPGWVWTRQLMGSTVFVAPSDHWWIARAGGEAASI